MKGQFFISSNCPKTNLELFVRQKFPGPSHFDSVASWVRRTLHVESEINGTHDAIAEFLMNQLLDGWSINAKCLSNGGQFQNDYQSVIAPTRLDSPHAIDTTMDLMEFLVNSCMGRFAAMPNVRPIN